MAPATIWPSTPMFQRPAANVTTSPAAAIATGAHAINVSANLVLPEKAPSPISFQCLQRRSIGQQQKSDRRRQSHDHRRNETCDPTSRSMWSRSDPATDQGPDLFGVGISGS